MPNVHFLILADIAAGCLRAADNAAQARRMGSAAPTTIDEYIEALPERSQAMLKQIRDQIRAAAPDAVEGIKYGMPTASLNGKSILYYAAWKVHIGLYPIYRGGPAFEAAVAPYRDKKDAVRFPLDMPLPTEIVGLILSTRVEMIRENRQG